MAVPAHPTYSRNVAPRYLTSSSNENQVKKLKFDILEEIQAESQVVLDVFAEADFREYYTDEKLANTGIFMLRETTLKVMTTITLKFNFNGNYRVSS